MKMMIFIGFMVFSSVGWWLGGMIDEGFVWPFIISSVGSIFGVVAGWWAAMQMGLE